MLFIKNMVLLQIIILSFYFVGSLSIDCTIDDYIPVYTDCIDNKHNLVYYKKKESETCTAGVGPPKVKFDIPCDISCPPGEYLPVGETSCSPCPAGSYSIGGGTKITENDWISSKPLVEYPFQLKTFSIISNNEADKNDTGWIIENGYISSGEIGDGVTSKLQLTAHIVRNEGGYIRFLYRVDAEPRWDGFFVEIDGNAVLGSSTKPISNQLTYELSEQYPLDKGTHIVTFNYHKDFSRSEGEDKASINTIQVYGDKHASDSCTPCPIGYYNNVPRSNECLPCPINHFSPIIGNTECTQCPSNEFSYSGSSGCTQRQGCTFNDYSKIYSTCSRENTRSLSYIFKTPIICNYESFTLPETETSLPCGPCNPGSNRNQGICKSCRTGSYSSDGIEACKECPSGHVAPKDTIITRFEELPKDSITYCSGDCSSNGWRLLQTEMDTGVGHGMSADITFKINTTLETPGEVEFTYILDCQNTCYITFTVPRVSTRFIYHFSSTEGFPQPKNMTVYIPVGTHELQWTFHRNDPHLTARNDRARITSIVIKGTSTGGAESCYKCPAGSYAPELSSYCQQCPPGSYSHEGAGFCTKCEPGTFTDLEGSTACLPCGRGTTSSKGAITCLDTCLFSQNENVQYDFSDLPRKQILFSVKNDNENFRATLHPCKRTTNNECPTDSTSPFTCLTDPSGIQASGGRILEYEPIEGEGDNTLNIKFTGGEPCDVENDQQTHTMVKFYCDPNEGTGTPEFIGRNTSICQWIFKWRTVYACPICKASDWKAQFSECKGAQHRKTYQWIQNPKRCHGGASLPKTEVVACTNELHLKCPPGYGYDPEARIRCVKCPMNTYSIGGGTSILNWEDLSQNASLLLYTMCTPSSNSENQNENDNATCEYLWESQESGQFVSSGSPNSVITWNLNFVRPGVIRFLYRSFLPSTQKLRVTIDRHERFISQKINYYWREASIPVGIGSHVINFTLVGPYETAEEKLSFVYIKRLIAVGTAWHDRECTRCPMGHETSQEGSRECQSCEVGSYTNSEGSSCRKCTGYSSMGGNKCYPLPQCLETSYYPFFSICNPDHGTTRMSLKVKESEPCIGLKTFPSETVTCKCPPGHIFTPTSQCNPCREGTYAKSPTECESVPRGHAAVLVKEIFGAETTQNVPTSIEMFCVGACVSGWQRSRGGLDSGLQVGLSDAVLSFTLSPSDLNEFAYLAVGFNMVSVSEGAYLMVLFDDTMVSLATNGESGVLRIPFQPPYYEDINTKLKQLLNVSIVFHNVQPPRNETDYSGRALINFIQVFGHKDGGGVLFPCDEGMFTPAESSQCHYCPAGTYNNEKASTSCDACDLGKWSSHRGSTECIACEETSPYLNHTALHLCVLNKCIFNSTKGVYNLDNVEKRAVIKPTNFPNFKNRVVFYINLCHEVSAPQCVDAQGAPLNTHVCRYDYASKTAANLGSNIRFSEEREGFSLIFENGDICYSRDKTASPLGQKNSVIHFICDPDAGDGKLSVVHDADEGGLKSEGDYRPCHTVFLWKSAAACRSCSYPDDFTAIYAYFCTGQCRSNSTRITNLVPSVRCYNTLANNSVVSETCDYKPGVSYYVIIPSVIIFISIVILAIVLYKKYLSLNHEYHLLRQRTNSGHSDDDLSGEFGEPIDIAQL